MGEPPRGALRHRNRRDDQEAAAHSPAGMANKARTGSEFDGPDRAGGRQAVAGECETTTAGEHDRLIGRQFATQPTVDRDPSAADHEPAGERAARVTVELEYARSRLRERAGARKHT